MAKKIDIFTIIMVGIFIVILVLILLSSFYKPTSVENNKTDSSLNALIIDSLGSGFTDTEKIFEIIKILCKAGFNVDVRIGAEVKTGHAFEKVKAYVNELKELVSGLEIREKVDIRLTNINVDFYRKILKQNYKVIILRVHSTYTPDLSKQGWKLPEGSVVIITQERYDKTKYVLEQLQEQLIPSFALNATGSPLAFGFFAITENFIKAQNADLKDATIIVLGCHGLYTDGLADAFINQGAITYFGFDGYVSSTYSDKVCIYLLKKLFLEKKSIKESITDTIANIGVDPAYGSTLLVKTRKDISLEDTLWSYYFKNG